MSKSKQNGRIVDEIRLGGLWSATLWANQTTSGEVFSVTLKRSYERKRGSGQWEQSKMSIPRHQLLQASELLREMFWRAETAASAVDDRGPARQGSRP